MQNRTGWQYAAAGLFIASIAAVISYNDGLFVARLAGNHDRQAYLYPLLADGLIMVGLLALVEAARLGLRRSRWAMAAVLLGVAMTLSMNAGAGIAHSVLDAVIDGLVPVVFFIAVEVVLWHVRRGRGTVPARGSPAAQAAPVTASVAVSLPGLREIQRRRKCSQKTAEKIRAEVTYDRRLTTREGNGNGQGQGGGGQVLRAAEVGVQGPGRSQGRRGDVPHGQQGQAAGPVEGRQRSRHQGRQGEVAAADVPAGVSSPPPGAAPAGALNGHAGG